MGLGKSLSVIAFLHAVMRRCSPKAPLGARSALIVCPLNVALNWTNEFRMWLGDEATQRRFGESPLPIRELTSMRLGSDRLTACREFMETGGVLIVNYDMFRNLAQGRGLSNKRKQRELYRRALLDPGPDIVVCDEGHVLKSGATGLSKAMCEIRTKRRIVLTGTPLQNNLIEYYTMVSFVKPSLLGTQKEFVNPINNGQHSDSTAFDVQLMKRRAHVLHKMLSGCVHRRDYTALTKYLPPKHEFIINIRLGEVQEQLYRKYLDQVRPLLFSHSVSLFADQQVLYRVWTHPHLLKLHEEEAAKRDRWTSSEDDEEDDDEEDGEQREDSGDSDEDADDNSDDSRRPVKHRRRRWLGSSDDSSESSSAADSSSADEVVTGWSTRSRGSKGAEAADNAAAAQAIVQPARPPQWWHPMYTDSMADDVSLSGKLHILFSLLRSFEEHGDKTLVFSQSLLSLDIIEHFLDKLGIGQPGEDYLRLDGSTSAASRKSMSEAFNKESDTRLRLFLISTKAGGLGVNLPAANRVVIFDVSWNPSHDIQSIFRTYRFGQTKPVFVYRLVAQGTMEEKIYSRQVNKQSLGFRVIDEHQINRHFSAADLVQLYTLTVDRFDPSIDARKRFDLPADGVLADLLASEARWIASYHLHDSLLENVESELLTDEERQQAWQEYEQEKHAPKARPQPPPQPQQTAATEDGPSSPEQQLRHSATVANFSGSAAALQQQPQKPPQPPPRAASSAALLQQPQPAMNPERQQITNLQLQYPLQFLNIRNQVNQQRTDLADKPAELDRLAYRYLLDFLRKQQEQRLQKLQQQNQ
uniref:Helicase ATP-binding domain-containing protein n=1 Tax=Macrostomum lignano TaxID=282301 RepID=A0A1I8IRD6_9PLAT